MQGHEAEEHQGEEKRGEAELDIEATVGKPVGDGEDRAVERKRSVQGVGVWERNPLSDRGTSGRGGNRDRGGSGNSVDDGSGNDCERCGQLTSSRSKRVKV